MENREKSKRRSSRALNTLITTIEETRVVNLNEEREVAVEAIDLLINFILKQLKNADPKFSFVIRNLSSIDSENNSVRQFHYFLTWASIVFFYFFIKKRLFYFLYFFLIERIK
jgi:hypothetical protein